MILLLNFLLLGIQSWLLVRRTSGELQFPYYFAILCLYSELTWGFTAHRWSSRAVRSFAMAELEARKMRYPTTGTEGLLMGILVEGEAKPRTILHLGKTFAHLLCLVGN